MARQLIHSFTIKIANNNKPKRQYSGNTKISRKCYAVVVKENGILKARIDTSPVEEISKLIIIPFTDRSFDLKGKTYVFYKNKDEHNHHVCRIRTTDQAELFPGLPTQYDALHENLLIAGYIVSKDGNLYFDYIDLVAFSETNNGYLEDVRINKDKPVFNNEYNRDKSS